MEDQKTDLAEMRTDWAQERTRLAKERTFAALVRTALSFIGFGFAVAKLVPDLRPAWAAQTLGIVLIVGGGILALLGFVRTSEIIGKLREEGVEDSRWHVATVTLLLLATAALALTAVMLL